MGKTVLKRGTHANDLILYYKDPQDGIQGSFSDAVSMFPGQPKRDSRDPVKKPSANLDNTGMNFIEPGSLATGSAEPSTLNPTFNNMDSFGLVCSELQVSQSKHSLSLNKSSGNGQTHLVNSNDSRVDPLAKPEEHSISGCTSSAPFVVEWSDTYRRPNLIATHETPLRVSSFTA